MRLFYPMSGHGGTNKTATHAILAATIFWTCIKIAKALRDFNGEK